MSDVTWSCLVGCVCVFGFQVSSEIMFHFASHTVYGGVYSVQSCDMHVIIHTVYGGVYSVQSCDVHVIIHTVYGGVYSVQSCDMHVIIHCTLRVEIRILYYVRLVYIIIISESTVFT